MAPVNQSAEAYAQLRAAVLGLELVPGERLSERGLETMFSVSRTPARAALLRLEAEGLVRRQGRGWIVAPIDLQEIGAVAEFRQAVESAAVRLAVERAAAPDLEALAEFLDAARPVFDEAEGIRAGRDFHTELAQLSQNSFMVEAIQGAMARLERTRWLEVRTPAARQQAWAEHRTILEAVIERDADKAQRLVVAHIRDTNERLVTSLAGQRRRLRAQGLIVQLDEAAR